MDAHCGQSIALRRTVLPSAMPIATPIAIQIATCPAATPNATPTAAPSAIPTPVCCDLLFITLLQICVALVGADEQNRPSHDIVPYYFPFAGGSMVFAFVLSPICRTLPKSSASGIPDSVSNSAGTCAAILVMSPVILFIPEESPFPVDTMVILSTLASGAASALTISGIPANSLSITAAWLYS